LERSSSAPLGQTDVRADARLHLPAGLADRAAEQLGRPKRRLALLALDRERGRDQRPAHRAAVPQRPGALRTFRRNVPLALLEEPQREPAAQAEPNPVPERLAALFLNPVPFRL